MSLLVNETTDEIWSIYSTGFDGYQTVNIPEEDFHPKFDKHGNELQVSTRKMWGRPLRMTGEYDEANKVGVSAPFDPLIDNTFVNNGHGTNWEDGQAPFNNDYTLLGGDVSQVNNSIDVFQGAIVLAYGSAHACWNRQGTKVAFNGNLSGNILNVIRTNAFATGAVDARATPQASFTDPQGTGSPGYAMNNALYGGEKPAYFYKGTDFSNFSTWFEQRWNAHLTVALLGCSCPLFKTDIFVLDIDDPDNPSQAFGNANTGLPEQITFNNSWGTRWHSSNPHYGHSDDWFNGRAHQEEYVRGWNFLGNRILVERIGYDPTDDPIEAQYSVGDPANSTAQRRARRETIARIYLKPYPSTSSSHNDTGDPYNDDRYYNHDDMLVAGPAPRFGGHPNTDFDGTYMYFKPNYHPLFGINRIISVSSLVGPGPGVTQTGDMQVTDICQLISNPLPPAIDGFNINDPWPISLRAPIFDGTAGRPAYGTYADDPYNTINFFNPVWSNDGKLIAMVGQKSGSDKISFWVCSGFTGIGTH